jgi:hypothetical protein
MSALENSAPSARLRTEDSPQDLAIQSQESLV